MTETAVDAVVDADPVLATRVRHALGLPPADRLAVLEGGRSGLTYEIGTGADRCVVKAVPPGRRARGRNDVLHQAAILTALAGSAVPVPGVRAVDAEPPAWFAMEFARGGAAEPILLVDAETAPALARTRMLVAARVLGALHAVPLDAVEHAVAASGRDVPPAAGAGAEVDRWAQTMQAVPEDLRPGGAALVEELLTTVPGPVPAVVVHGDFRLGNLLFEGADPVALVDWEIWGVGDPRVDLGWFGVFTDGRLFPGSGRVVEGLPTERELGEAYREARGEDGGTTADAAWFSALGRMKMAAIMGHNLLRHRTGAHHDPVQEQLPPAIAALIADGRRLLAEGLR
ncbi:phosphotransferase family protein [Pseudonocardia broussonetiae]|uniref:Phosphotransferase family protein n=1 Tax=Pseudonocardia broussonetiae TaxID=2736640 RepID=A0A6M6JLC6_9PSEU|nr:phosphotransferase family protein [Pseudonocardia broussonetiae]QJY47111.1 phosphotransferase family protein [Pseudonocardia broussonetiae]